MSTNHSSSINNTATSSGECIICCTEASTDNVLYVPANHSPCNKSLFLCAGCSTAQIAEWINSRAFGALLTNTLSCFNAKKCAKTLSISAEFIDSFASEESKRKISSALATIPASTPFSANPPTTIADFNYKYDDSHTGKLIQQNTGNNFVFITQRHYEALGDVITEHLQTMLQEKYKFKQVLLPISKQTRAQLNEMAGSNKNIAEVKLSEEQLSHVPIYISSDFFTNTKGLLILIQGSGAVRPPQWARSLCINEDLSLGTQFPYIERAFQLGWSVIILNPNQNTYQAAAAQRSKAEVKAKEEDAKQYYLNPDKSTGGGEKTVSLLKVPGNENNRAHGLYVFDNIISPYSPAQNYALVAHSAGGDTTMNLLRNREKDLLPKLRCVAFTDAVHSVLPSESKAIKQFLQANGIHFVASNKPLNTEIKKRSSLLGPAATAEFSAGHDKHEYTSQCSIQPLFTFLQSKMPK
jgi:hypothetical protein